MVVRSSKILEGDCVDVSFWSKGYGRIDVNRIVIRCDRYD